MPKTNKKKTNKIGEKFKEKKFTHQTFS